MDRSDKVKNFVSYIIENVKDDGSLLRIEFDDCEDIVGPTSRQTFTRYKYEAIASVDMPDSIVMEMLPITGRAKTRLKGEYGYRKINDFLQYKISERIFRKITDKDIKAIEDAFSDVSGVGKRQLMTIMFIVDVLAVKLEPPMHWLRIKQGYLSSYFMIPEDVIRQYIAILKKSGILIEAVHPRDGKPIYRLNLECQQEPENNSDFSSSVVGYTYITANKLRHLLNDGGKCDSHIDMPNKHNIIYENNTMANALHNHNTTDESISTAIAALNSAINNRIGTLESEVTELRSKVKDYDASSKAFNALNEQFQETVKEKEEIEESYISPKKMVEIKKTLIEKTSSVLNKLSSDVMLQLTKVNNEADINAMRTNVMCLVMDSIRSVTNYVKNMEKFAEASRHK